MPIFLVALLGLVCALAGSGPVAQQGLPPGAKLAAIEVIGLQNLPRDAVLSHVDLKLGAPVAMADLEAAADRLARSGLVSEASFAYRFRGTEVTATFTVRESVADRTVLFDNFPWFTDEELTAAVAARLPGFAGRVSNSVESFDQVRRALSGLLRTRSIPGQVENMPYLDMRTGAAGEVFRVTGDELRVAGVEFKGVQPSLEADMRSETASLVGRDYSRRAATEFLKPTVSAFYRRRGYLKNQLTRVDGRKADDGVVITFVVDEGLAYSWNGITWAGNRDITTAALDAHLPLKAGAVADGTKLDEGLKNVERAYGRVGHLLVRLQPAPRFDDAARTVAFDIAVEEGPQFRMGLLVVEGFAADMEARLRQHWKLKGGDVYDAEYRLALLKALGSDLPLAAAVRKARVTVRADRKAFTVDVIYSL